MDKATAMSGVLQERNALQSQESISNPTYISEHMHLLAQYNSVLEEILGDAQKDVEVRESKLFAQYIKDMSVNAAVTKIKYEVAEEKSEVTRLQRLCSSSWRLISESQSRIKHLIQESQNQI